MKRYYLLFKQAFTEFGEDKAQRLGAALAYYTIFSLAPLLLIAISIAGMVFGREAAQGQIFGQLHGVLGAQAAAAVQEMVKGAAKPKSGSMATIIGVVTLLFGAAGVFGQLKEALNTIWNVEPPKKGGFMKLIKDRFLSFAMVFGTGFLLLVSLVLDAGVAAAGHFVGSRLPGGEALWQVVQIVLSLGVVTLLFALIFRFLPDVHPTWRDVWFGAIFTAVLFVLGKFALGLYLGKSAVGSSYGAAGSLVVLLLWVYYSAQILFFGAEFTQVYARTHGSMAEAKDKAPAAPARPAPTPVVMIPPAPAGGAMKLAAGGAVGLFLGTLLGGVGAVVMVLKSMKKLFS
ncbi:MAG TPA: YihY/virulence factor BrkB family protein [Thermoanaerobaculia bacterium]|nr:YihY/virulence factor BrkB family protein [Thermoanaerobaculia bacterium]